MTFDFIKILQYWFPNDKFNKSWFAGEKNDEYIIHNFMEDYHNAINTYITNKLDFSNIDMLIAFIIITDQFNRHINRHDEETKRINDEYALKISRYILENNMDLEQPVNKKIFILMPYRHKFTDDSYKVVLERIGIYEEIHGSDDKLLNKFKKVTHLKIIEHNLFK